MQTSLSISPVTRGHFVKMLRTLEPQGIIFINVCFLIHFEIVWPLVKTFHPSSSPASHGQIVKMLIPHAPHGNLPIFCLE